MSMVYDCLSKEGLDENKLIGGEKLSAIINWFVLWHLPWKENYNEDSFVGSGNPQLDCKCGNGSQ